VPDGDHPAAGGHGQRWGWRKTVAAVATVVVSVATVVLATPAEAAPPPDRPAPPPLGNVFPIPSPYPVTFSDSWHACRDGCARQHKGNDLMADEGTPLVAVESGTIVRASDTDRGLGGITLWLLGESGIAYYYAHNVENLVSEGQTVARGQTIARVGSTGNASSTAPHVHFQMNLCGDTSSAEPCTVDPHPHLLRWAQRSIDGGVDGIGWYQPSTASFGRRTEAGSPLPAVSFGEADADTVPVAGDWDGDGRDTLGLWSRADATFALLDGEGSVAEKVRFGEPGRQGVWPNAGDLAGDGHDTLGLYDQADGTFVVLVDDGVASAPVALGEPGRSDARPVVGDWDGDGRDGLGLFHQRDGEVLRVDDEGEKLAPATATAHGRKVLPLAGDWDGDGRDEVGVLRRGEQAAELPRPTPDDADAVWRVEIEGGADVLPVAGDWNGHDLVSADEMRQVFGPMADDPTVADGLPGLNAAMLRAGINTPARKAAFLATLRSESAFRFDAVEAGNDHRYRGRGFIQLTGAPNYTAAGDDLELDLADNPDLAVNGLVSPAVAAWYWTVARDINVSADAFDMAAVNIAIGYAPTMRRDMVRCGDFLEALRYFSGEEPPDAVNCERTAQSHLRAFAATLPFSFGDTGPSAPSGTAWLPTGAVADDWAPTSSPTVAPDDPATGPARPPTTRPQTTTTRPAPPPTGSSTSPSTTRPPTTGTSATPPPTSATTVPSTGDPDPTTPPPTTATTVPSTDPGPTTSTTTSATTSPCAETPPSTSTTSTTGPCGTGLVPDSTTTTTLLSPGGP
jgi:hypothetical protein